MTAIPTESEVRQQLIADCPVLEEILSTSQTIAASGEKIATAGFSTIRNLVVLRRLMDLGRFAKTLEVGLAHGGSALTLATAHRVLGHTAQNQHVAIDPFQNGYLKGGGLLALERAGLAGFVKHVSELSQTALPAMMKAGEKHGLIYIDGSHSFDDVFTDFYFCDHLLELNGYMVFDDCADYRVRKVSRFVERNYSFAYTEVYLEKLFVPSNLLRIKAARALGKNQIRIFQRTADLYREWDSPLKSF